MALLLLVHFSGVVVVLVVLESEEKERKEKSSGEEIKMNINIVQGGKIFLSEVFASHRTARRDAC